MAKIITFSGYGGVGKDTCASIIKEKLQDKGLRVFEIAYGDPVKASAARNFGYSENEKIKQREILTKWGTDYVRSRDPGFWVKIANMFVELLKDEYDVFIMTDARFENEMNHDVFDKDIPIYRVLVVREDDNLTEEQSLHSSEQLNKNIDLFDFIIRNDGTLDDLDDICNLCINHLGEWFRMGEAA